MVMPTTTLIFHNADWDAVTSMYIGRALTTMPGISDAAVLAGTEANKAALHGTPLFTPEVEATGANSLFVVVQASESSQAEKALAQALRVVQSCTVQFAARRHGSFEAVQAIAGTNLTLIALPGTLVRQAAMDALAAGRDVLIASDNLSVDDERQIKATAHERGQLVMGPACDTAIIDGVGLGFANAVRRGPIGLISTTGSGIQSVSCLIHRLGSGISQAICVGAHDLTAEIGGISMIDSISRLEEDDDTEVIVIVANAPTPNVARVVLERARDCMKPLVLQFIGSNVQGVDEHMAFVRTLHEAATAAVDLVGGDMGELEAEVDPPNSRSRDRERVIRGFFSGNALASEAVAMLRRRLGQVATNALIQSAMPLPDDPALLGHAVFDLNNAPFIAGRMHPLIDLSLRSELIAQAARDPRTGVILFDLLGGAGTPTNAASQLADAVQQAQQIAKDAGRSLTFVASVCGTDDDAQPRADAVAALSAAGVLVAPSNTVAADWAARAVATR